MSSFGADSSDPTPPVSTTPRPSSPSCAGAPLLTLPVQEVVKLAVGWLASSDRMATVPAISTPHVMLTAAATSIADDSTTVAILPPNRHELVRKVVGREAARVEMLQELGHNGALRVRVTADSPLPGSLRPIPPPTTKSRARMKKLREIAATIPYYNEPYFTVCALCAKEYLPSLPTAVLSLCYDDDEITNPSFTVTGHEIPIIWDTGNPITRVSIHAISKQFLDGLLSPDYTAKNPEGTVFSVDGVLRFSDVSVAISFPVRVEAKLPNDFKGVLLGQLGLINSLQVLQTPRDLLVANGQALDESYWGEMQIRKYIDPDANVFSF